MTLQTPVLQGASARNGRTVRTPSRTTDADPRPAIDLVHLARQTLGDRDLELELLALFARQARSIVAALGASAHGGSTPSTQAGDLLHTLCGSARAIGAWGVAEEAQDVQHCDRSAVIDGVATPNPDRFASLRDRVHCACAVIDELLQDQEWHSATERHSRHVR